LLTLSPTVERLDNTQKRESVHETLLQPRRGRALRVGLRTFVVLSGMAEARKALEEYTGKIPAREDAMTNSKRLGWSILGVAGLLLGGPSTLLAQEVRNPAALKEGGRLLAYL